MFIIWKKQYNQQTNTIINHSIFIIIKTLKSLPSQPQQQQHHSSTQSHTQSQPFLSWMQPHNSHLKEQLKKISAQINKKYTTLRKQLLKTSQVFDNDQLPVFPYQVCYGLFRQIVETGSVSASISFFTFLQAIITLGFANREMSREILNLLMQVKGIPRFMALENQLKMLQILAILVSKSCIELANLGFTHSLVNVILSLQNLKYKQLWIKSSQILYQTFSLLLNCLKENPTQQNFIMFTKFFGEIARMITGQQPQPHWLIQFVDPYLLLQVLGQLIDDKYFWDIFQKQRRIQIENKRNKEKAIKEQKLQKQQQTQQKTQKLQKQQQSVSPSKPKPSSSLASLSASSSLLPLRQVLISLQSHIRKQIRKSYELSHTPNPIKPDLLSSHKNWQLTPECKLLILFRFGCKVNIIARVGYEMLQQIIKILSDKRISLGKAIAYEAVNFLLRNSGWMYEMFQSQYADLFNFLLTTEFNTVKFIYSDQKDNKQKDIKDRSQMRQKSELRQKIDLLSNNIGQQTNYPKILSSTSLQIFPIDFTPSHQIKLIIKTLEQTTHSLFTIYSQILGLNLSIRNPKPPLLPTYKFIQKTIFQTLKTLLPKQMPQPTLQSLLKISQKFINLSGSFSDLSVTALYLKLMCKYCLPTEWKNIEYRHIQINKMILNTVNCLGELIGVGCWVIVWKTLENYAMCYRRYLLGKEELQKEREADVQILYKSMDAIFVESPKYADMYLLEVVRSLIQVAYECLENNYNDETRKIFAFERIEQIYRLNLFRLCIIWPELSSSLLCITTSKVMYFRLSALSLLNTLIPLSLNYLHNHPQCLTQSQSLPPSDPLVPQSSPKTPFQVSQSSIPVSTPSTPFTPQTYQLLLLQPWLALISCQFHETRQQFLSSVSKLVIDYGHIMTHGWQSIMEILRKSQDLKLVQVIVETFLEKVHNWIMDLVLIVDGIERGLKDTNQKYLCLTMIWAIADYARKSEMFDVLERIYGILLVPEEMFNLGTQARHSSFYIFAEIIVHNCAEKSPKFWEWIFKEIERFYTYGINQCLVAKNRTFAQQALKNLLTNLIKVYKKFFLVSKEWPSSPSSSPSAPSPSKSPLSSFFTFCSHLLQFRSPQTYPYLLKNIKQILYPKMKESLLLPEFYTFLQNLAQVYYVENDGKLLKCLITYLPPDVYQILGNGIQGVGYGDGLGFVDMYRLVEKMYLMRLEALEKEIKLGQLRIFFQEKYHYQYMRKLQSYIVDTPLLSLYLESTCKTLHKLKLYQDYPSIIKMLPFITNAHIKHPQIASTMVLQTYREIVRVRTQGKQKEKQGKEKEGVKEGKDKDGGNRDKEVPVWYICSQDIMKIAFQYLQKGYKKGVQDAYLILKELVINDQTSAIPEKQATYYYQNQLEICHFLIENYFFSSLQEGHSPPLEHLSSIVQLLKTRSFQIEQEDPTKKAYNAYQLLFKLAQERGQQGYGKGVENNQSEIVRVLFQRINKTFQKYTKKQQKQQPESPTKKPQSSMEQLKFTIKHLFSLSLRPKILQSLPSLFPSYPNSTSLTPTKSALVLQLKEAHLFYFQPQISKCLRCGDADVIEGIRGIMERSCGVLFQIGSLDYQQKEKINTIQETAIEPQAKKQ